MDDALHLMWRAHVSSIAYALPKFQDRYRDERGGPGGSSYLHASLEGQYPNKVTLDLCSLGSTLPSALLEHGMTSERWLPRLPWVGRLWV